MTRLWRLFIAYLRWPFKDMNKGRTDWQRSPVVFLWALFAGIWYTPMLFALLLIGIGIFQAFIA